jgi:hypothetical protein
MSKALSVSASTEDRTCPVKGEVEAQGYNPFCRRSFDPFAPATFDSTWRDLYRLYRKDWLQPRLARFLALGAAISGELTVPPTRIGIARAILSEWREVA